jgi:hypothetical protein
MKLSLPSVAIGVAIAAVPTVLIRIAVVGPVHIAGVPTAEDIVNIHLGMIAQPPSGQPRALLYTVPNNRWLVLTGCSPRAGGTLYETRGSNAEPMLDLGSLVYSQGGSGPDPIVYAGGSPFPLAFAPGSKVEIDNWSPMPAVTLTGYLE